MRILPLFAHQKQSLSFFDGVPRGLDFSDPGTGKTRVQIEDFAARRARGAGSALILAPKSLLKSAWGDDIRRFGAGLTTSIAYANNRDDAFAEDADIYITNLDAAKWLAAQRPKFFQRFRNGTLILDESSAFKHHTSQRSKALNKVKVNFEYRRAMTGTPTSNGILDLWHQVFVIEDGKRLGKTYFGFRNSVCTPQQVGPRPEHIKWVDRPGIEAAVYGLLKDIVVRHKFEECIDIPENHQYNVSFHLNPSHRRKYDVLSRDALLLVHDKVVSAVHAASLLTKLLQCASGAVYAEGGGYAVLDTDRYEMVLDLVEQRQHSVVFFNWQHQRDQLIAEAEKRGVTFAVLDGTTPDRERSRIVDEYQAGYYRALFAHPQSAAHGLTLTRGTTTIWSSPTYNLEHFLQGNKRIYRAGQTQRTETIMLVAPDTIEEQVWQRLQVKDERQGSLLELLQTPVFREAA